MAEDYRERFLKLEREHDFLLDNGKVEKNYYVDEIEETYKKKISRLEFINSKQH